MQPRGLLSNCARIGFATASVVAMAYTAWVDFIVHKLIPVVVVADWLIDPPQHLVGNRRVPRSN